MVVSAACREKKSKIYPSIRSPSKETPPFCGALPDIVSSATVIVLCDVQRTHAHTLKEREAEKESTRDQESGSREQKKERWKERDLHVTRAIPQRFSPLSLDLELALHSVSCENIVI